MDAAIPQFESDDLSQVLTQLARIASAQERVASALEKSLDKSPRVTTATDASERDAIAALCQLQSERKRISISAIARMLNLPRQTLVNRAKNWPTFNEFMGPQSTRSIRQGTIDDGVVTGISGEDFTSNW